MSKPPILTDDFFFDSRGPTLEWIDWAFDGSYLRAIDFDGKRGKSHLFFDNTRICLVADYENISDNSITQMKIENEICSAISFGKSEWFQAFDNLGLEQCSHFRFLFYDHVIDFICENVEVRSGYYRGGIIQRE